MKATRSNGLKLRQLISGCSLSAMLFAQNVSAFEIANVPPFLPTPLPANIVMTFDDSGSMRWAYAPDSICGEHATRRVKSADYNPIYYNPRVQYLAPERYDAANNSYVAYTTSFTQAKVNGFEASHGTVNLSSGYRPTWSYEPSTNGTPAENNDPCGSTTLINNNFARHPSSDYSNQSAYVRAYYYVFNSAQCSSKDKADDACYSRVRVGVDPPGGGVVANPAFPADETQNFANWYSFYRTRNLMTATSAMLALKDVPLTTRLAWQALNSCNGTTSSVASGVQFDDSCRGWTASGVTSNNVDRRIRPFSGQHRQNMYHWLSRLPATGSTPLRSALSRAGQYYMSKGFRSPYALNPQVDDGGTEYSCRPNFNIMLTDGVWYSNADTSSNFCGGSSCGNADNTALDLPASPGDTKPWKYSTSSGLTRIYRSSENQSSAGNNLADIAFYYWATDLRPDLKNDLFPYWAEREGDEDRDFWNPKNDPAKWQHMVTFTVGLGLTGFLNLSNRVWPGSTYGEPAYGNLTNPTGSVSWPATGTSTQWTQANTTAQLAQGRVYDLWHAAINSRGQAFSAETASDLSEALEKTLDRIFATDTTAAALSTSSTRLATDTLLFQASFYSDAWTGGLTAYSLGSDGAVGPVAWEATKDNRIPAHNARRIFTWSGTEGIPFQWASLPADLQSSIGSEAKLDYLRGDKSNESPSGQKFRNRKSPLDKDPGDNQARLGDIINSDPLFVFAENFGYTALAGTEGSTYPAFLTTKKNRLKMLYVGGNDGFLRAFNAVTGAEIFSYTPKAVIPDMRLLAEPDYVHRFYVDGSPTAWDANFAIGSGQASWRTVLMGTTGAGGRSVFALDVTSPSSFGASNVLWEINQNTTTRTGDAEDPQYGARLGYTIGQAVVAKLNTGEWAAIFGNGYRSPGSTSPDIPGEQASLYIVRISDGTLIKRIDTGFGSAGAPNGLGTPTLFDVNGDEIYDVAYAPDMRGNVWKFDLAGGSPSAWDVAFKSGSTKLPLFQAVLSSFQPISARIELASPPPGKAGIMVLFGTGRLFAVGDNTDKAPQTFYGIWDSGSPITVTDRSTLQAQTISTRSIDLRGTSTTVRDVTTNPIDWSTKRGWYIDLPTSMERVIGSAAVRDNRVIFTTLIPSTNPCDFGGSGWLMEVSATTGAQLPSAVFDTTGDKLVTAKDEIIAGVPIGVGMVKRPLVIDGSPVAAKFLSGTTGDIQLERNRTFGPPLGRESWREVQR